MDSTFKVGYNSQTGRAVCKIIFKEITQIKEVKSSNPQTTPDSIVWHEDDDERDKMVREFLHHPLYSEPYEFYQKGSRLSIAGGKTLITIEPIDERDLFYRFRQAALNRFVPYDTLIELNRIKSHVRSGEIDPDEHQSLLAGVRKYFPGEDLAHKINDFFDWLDDREYATHAQRWPNVE
jgi:hypothetical protein